jgi:hypothetical protein
MAGEIFNNCNLKTFVDFSAGRDDLGTSIELHTASERAGYLKRNPGVDAAALPPVRDANARPTITDSWGSVNGMPLARREAARDAALLRDHVPVRSAPTKPRVATELSRYGLCCHEAAHACIANLAFGRPIVRVTINSSDDGLLGHAWNYHTGDTNCDDLVILAAGRIAEEELLGDVFEAGCASDNKKARDLALKLAHGDTELAETILFGATESARGFVKHYTPTIRRFALRLAAKREFILDEAEAAIRKAHEEVTAADVEAEWDRKVAYARARQSVREYKDQRMAKAAPTAAKVIRTYDCNNKCDVTALLRRFPGLGDGGQDYSVRSGE